jgi:hypothetical protein
MADFTSARTVCTALIHSIKIDYLCHKVTEEDITNLQRDFDSLMSTGRPANGSHITPLREGIEQIA